MSRITVYGRVQTASQRQLSAASTQIASSVSELRYLSRAMSTSCILEEDQQPDYASKRFYPAWIGETIFGRYCIISKLGWGANSTVWLTKDTNRSVHPLLS